MKYEKTMKYESGDFPHATSHRLYSEILGCKIAKIFDIIIRFGQNVELLKLSKNIVQRTTVNERGEDTNEESNKFTIKYPLSMASFRCERQERGRSHITVNKSRVDI
jgi:hypothetical protein